MTKYDKVVRLIPVSVIDKDLYTIIITSKNQVIPNIDLSKISTKSGVDLAKDLKIDQIYFNYNKFDIRPDALLDLDNLVAYMNLNPSVKIEIGSHTDCIGSLASNLVLSQKRANSTLNYIVAQGIDASRLSAVGYGESRLVNNCSDGVPCSKEQNQKNRRSSFVIIDK
jgi:outer membrane protein OmpA-like peptidoglycan-associated protein